MKKNELVSDICIPKIEQVIYMRNKGLQLVCKL